MSVVDWRSEQDYANFEKAETADFAWEYLRRDIEYEQEFRNLTSAAQSSGAPHQFRKKWGLSFRS
jgi:heme-degrading monooxygenase HmoA